MSDSVNQPHERFTVWAGGLIGLAGVLMLFDHAGSSLYIDDTYSFPFAGTIARITTGVILFAGFVVLAAGRRRGAHLTGTSPRGAALLAIFGAVVVAGFLASAATAGSPTTRAWFLVVVRVIVIVAGLVAAAAMRRTHLADRSTQLLLAAAAWILAVATLFQLVPVPAALATALGVLFALSLLALGASVTVDGRHQQIRARLQSARHNW